MATQILFLQGAGEGTHADWDSKLVDSLRRELGAGYDVRYPAMPGEGDPDFARWVAAFEAELARLDDGAVVVGHSFGATVAVLALAKAPPVRSLAGLFLIAPPFFGEGGWDSQEMAAGPTSARGCRRGCQSASIRATRTTTCRPRTWRSMRRRFRRRRRTRCRAATTS